MAVGAALAIPIGGIVGIVLAILLLCLLCGLCAYCYFCGAWGKGGRRRGAWPFRAYRDCIGHGGAGPTRLLGLVLVRARLAGRERAR